MREESLSRTCRRRTRASEEEEDASSEEDSDSSEEKRERREGNGKKVADVVCVSQEGIFYTQHGQTTHLLLEPRRAEARVRAGDVGVPARRPRPGGGVGGVVVRVRLGRG